MNSIYDYRKFAVLYVDDEEMSRKYFTRAFQDYFRIFTAANVAEGSKIFDQHKDEIAVVISDQRMPGEPGVRLLEKARELRPQTIRILTTAYSDLGAAIEAVNSGAIYKYLTKPWDLPQFEVTIKRGLEFFLLQRERDQLLREKLSTIHNLMITDRVVTLGVVAAGLGQHLRNSLTAVQRFIDLAPAKLAEEDLDIDRLRNPNFWVDFYRHVMTQLERTTKLLGDLVIAPEKPRAPFTKQVDIRGIIDGAISRLRLGLEAKQIGVTSQIPGDLPLLYGERDKFQRLFELLLASQREHLATGGKIHLAANQIGQPDNPSVRIELSDDGAVFPDAMLRSLFDPFYLKDDSFYEIGVNLMAAYFIVYHHGGTIEARQGEQGGTRFSLTFPVEPSPTSPDDDEQAFLRKVVMNDALWEKLVSSE